ncbi:tripartite tricarboxylate transporter substrate-binding protein [Roseomonas populi]|uniref:tripartite tricarboxylate transporter substrate-binding protein n=1 Tax=Roseomonas populi TaxID=3121582 RepID=UPI0038CDBEAB
MQRQPTTFPIGVASPPDCDGSTDGRHSAGKRPSRGAIRAGNARALDVASAAAWPSLDARPVGQSAPGFEVVSWVGLVALGGTPASIVARLNAELVKVLAMPEVRRSLETLRSPPSPSTQEAMQAFVSGTIRQWQKVVCEAGIERQ